MLKRDILYLNVENAFSTGILQSMVVRPALALQVQFGYQIGFTSMYRKSEARLARVEVPETIPVISGRRSERGLSVENVILHLIFLSRILWHSRHYKVLHCRSYMATLIGLICKSLWNQKVVFDVRGYLIDEAMETGKLREGSLKYRLLKKMEKYLFANADAVIAVSEAMARDIADRFSRQAIIIRNPADIPVEGTRVRSLSEKIISYNGSLNEWHLPELFFATIREVADRDPDFSFIMITSDVAKAEALATRYGLGSDRLTVDRCKASEVIGRLKGCGIGWCVIRPSFTKSVCWPVKFNEYLAAGLPVIVNPGIGDLEQLVKRYELGIVVSIDEGAAAIAETILSYFAKHPAFKVPAELAQTVSWDSQLPTLHDCYQSLLSGPSGQ